MLQSAIRPTTAGWCWHVTQWVVNITWWHVGKHEFLRSLNSFVNSVKLSSTSFTTLTCTWPVSLIQRQQEMYVYVRNATVNIAITSYIQGFQCTPEGVAQVGFIFISSVYFKAVTQVSLVSVLGLVYNELTRVDSACSVSLDVIFITNSTQNTHKYQNINIDFACLRCSVVLVWFSTVFIYRNKRCIYIMCNWEKIKNESF